MRLFSCSRSENRPGRGRLILRHSRSLSRSGGWPAFWTGSRPLTSQDRVQPAAFRMAIRGSVDEERKTSGRSPSSCPSGRRVGGKRFLRSGPVRGSLRMRHDWPAAALVEAGKLCLGAARRARRIEIALQLVVSQRTAASASIAQRLAGPGAVASLGPFRGVSHEEEHLVDRRGRPPACRMQFPRRDIVKSGRRDEAVAGAGRI